VGPHSAGVRLDWSKFVVQKIVQCKRSTSTPDFIVANKAIMSFAFLCKDVVVDLRDEEEKSLLQAFLPWNPKSSRTVRILLSKDQSEPVPPKGWQFCYYRLYKLVRHRGKVVQNYRCES
jgi:hypothetical protein